MRNHRDALHPVNDPCAFSSNNRVARSLNAQLLTAYNHRSSPFCCSFKIILYSIWSDLTTASLVLVLRLFHCGTASAVLQNMPNPTIVIIQGAATTAEHYASLRQKFEAKGYPVISQDPPSITAEDATIVTIDVDIGFVRDAVLGPLLAESKDIVLICHSYGGSYGAGAVRGLSKKERTAKGEQGGVIGIIYIASFCTEPGESALQTLGIGDEIPVWVGPGVS